MGFEHKSVWTPNLSLLPSASSCCYCLPAGLSNPRLVHVSPLVTQSLSHRPAPDPKPNPQRLVTSGSTHNPRHLTPDTLLNLRGHPSLLTGHGHDHGKSSEDPSQALAAEEEGAVGRRHGAQLPEEAALQNGTESCGGTSCGGDCHSARQAWGSLEEVSAGCTGTLHEAGRHKTPGILVQQPALPGRSSSEVSGPEGQLSGRCGPGTRGLAFPSGPRFLIRDVAAAAADFPFWTHRSFQLPKRGQPKPWVGWAGRWAGAVALTVDEPDGGHGDGEEGSGAHVHLDQRRRQGEEQQDDQQAAQDPHHLRDAAHEAGAR